MPKYMLILVTAVLTLCGCVTHPETNTIQHPDAAVVRIRAMGSDGTAQAESCGFFVSSDGMLVTSREAVAGSKQLMVLHGNCPPSKADFVEDDPESDLAIFQVHVVLKPYEPALAFLQLKETDATPKSHVRVATPGKVVHGLFDHWENTGRDLSLVAQLSPTNAGCPVLDDEGHVIGIIRTPIPAPSGGAEAIPAWRLVRMMPKLAQSPW